MRVLVMDCLCRAQELQVNHDKTGLLQRAVSATSAIDICVLYTYDAPQECSKLMQAMLADDAFRGGLQLDTAQVVTFVAMRNFNSIGFQT